MELRIDLRSQSYFFVVAHFFPLLFVIIFLSFYSSCFNLDWICGQNRKNKLKNNKKKLQQKKSGGRWTYLTLFRDVRIGWSIYIQVLIIETFPIFTFKIMKSFVCHFQKRIYINFIIQMALKI